MPIRNLFIYNAREGDQIVIDSRLIKRRGSPSPERHVVVNGLRIMFETDFALAVHSGGVDSLATVHLNTDEWRSTPSSEFDFSIYGRGQNVKVTLEV